MNEKHIKLIIDNLCKAYNYHVMEIKNNEGLISSWAAVKNDANDTRIVVFAQNNLSETNLNRIEEEISKNYNYENTKIIPICFINDGSEDNPQPEEINNKFIVIDNKNNGVILKDHNNMQLANELQSILNWYANESKPENKPKVTFALIGINILMYLITIVLTAIVLGGSFVGALPSAIFNSDNSVLLFLGAKANDLINQGQYYRLITCMFLHGGLLHVALNMYALYNIGPLVERIYGKIKYLIVYFAAGITASTFSYLFSNDISIGASGAIFGLLGIILVFAVSERERVGSEFYKSILRVIVVNLIIGLSIPNIDNYAHLGELIGGAIIGLIYMIIKNNSQKKPSF